MTRSQRLIAIVLGGLFIALHLPFLPVWLEATSHLVAEVGRHAFIMGRADQGPVALMIENFRTGLIWKLMRRCPYLVDGLRRAGFTGGWL